MEAQPAECEETSSNTRPSLLSAGGDLIVSHLLLIQSELQDLRREVQELRSARKPQGPMADAEWLKPSDMAAVLGVPVRTLQGWHRRHRVPADAVKQAVNGSRRDNLFHRERTIKAVSSGVVYGADAE